MFVSMLSKSRRSHFRAFSDLVTCIVINLDSRPERWQRVERNCRQRGISPIRFSAHDGDSGRRAFPASDLSPAQLGLWSSFKAVAESNVDTEWILVLEDDAILLPRFRSNLLKEIRRADSSIVAIRLGWLGSFVWRHGMTIGSYVRRVPRRLLGRARHTIRGTLTDRENFRPRSLWGTQALLIRRDGVVQLLEALGEGTRALDHAFIEAEWSKPEKFKRARRNLAWQSPSPSSIPLRKGSGES
jgi:GR25 family glycosyltransferase involved in LPS biosynthesis